MITENGKSTTGKYRFIDDSYMELSVTGTLQKTNTINLRTGLRGFFNGDKADLTLTITNKQGPPFSQTLHYTRVD